MEWGNDRLVRITHEEDLAILSQNGGGCSREHWPWVCAVEPPCEYFFVLETGGRVSVILFCKDLRWKGKKHPQEHKLLNEVRRRQIPYTSDYYDNSWWLGAHNKDHKLKRAEERLLVAKKEYDYQKRYALKFGPLGKDNPAKDRVDAANKYITQCKGVIDQINLGRSVDEGMEFPYRGVELFIIQIAGRGIDYHGSNTRHNNRILEWMEKERA